MNARSHNRCALQCVALLILMVVMVACSPRRLINIGTAVHAQTMCVAKYGPNVTSYVNHHGDAVCEYVKP